MELKLLFCVVLFAFVSGEPADNNSCDNVKLIPNFNSQNIEGIWYIHAISEYPAIIDCMKYDFNLSNNTHVFSLRERLGYLLLTYVAVANIYFFGFREYENVTMKYRHKNNTSKFTMKLLYDNDNSKIT